jgi:Xaa-Pro aminopeptidase
MELEVAAAFRTPLSTHAPHAERAGGFAFCMSGPNAARAYGAYAQSSARKLARGDLALVHCNSYVDGFWTDITRTYCLGAPGARERDMYTAVFEARSAALDALRPGVRAQDVDAAARDVLRRHGFGGAFKHALGHGVGFAAIDHDAHPRIHPKSTEVLEAGMVFNIEPAIYLEGITGMRHCDVVALTGSGPQVLTPFQAGMEELILAEV